MAEETLDPEHQTQGDTKEGACQMCQCSDCCITSVTCGSSVNSTSLLSLGCATPGLYFGRDLPADSEEAKLPLHGPNQWPSEVGLALKCSLELKIQPCIAQQVIISPADAAPSEAT